MSRLTFLLLSILALSANAFANNNPGYQEGAMGALNEYRSIVHDFMQLQLEQRTQTALNSMVKEANGVLRERGFTAEADQAQKEWNGFYSTYFISMNVLDLGDHKPLNAWLANYYKMLSDRLGDAILKFFHFDDLNTMNYAIPVVFQPSGDRRNGDHWNKLEYSRHFIPFSGIVVYWGAYVGCTVATKAHPAFKKYCGLASTTLKNLTRSTFAPKMSDYVFNKLGGRQAEFVINMAAVDEQARMQLMQIPQD